MICVRCIVTGRVQGVFYRASTRNKAVELNLCGYVRNLIDGSVEVVARGDEISLREFKDWLWLGPMYAKVSNVSCEAITEAAENLSDKYSESDGFEVI